MVSADSDDVVISKKAPGKRIDTRTVVLHMKGSEAYAAWLDSLHERTRIPRSELFRSAIWEWAERRGFPLPPEI